MVLHAAPRSGSTTIAQCRMRGAGRSTCTPLKVSNLFGKPLRGSQGEGSTASVPLHLPAARIATLCILVGNISPKPCPLLCFLRSLTGELFQGGYAAALMLLARSLPAIIAAMFGLRWVLMTLEAPLLSLVGPALNWKEVLFSALGGLRGGLALILAQTVLAAHSTVDPQLKVGRSGVM